MLFAAGFGTRMGELTANRPKPLIEVAGKPLIDHALDLVARALLEHETISGAEVPNPTMVMPMIMIETPSRCAIAAAPSTKPRTCRPTSRSTSTTKAPRRPCRLA